MLLNGLISDITITGLRKRIYALKKWQVLLILMFATEFFTLILNSVQSFLWWGYWSAELIMIGTIDAFIIVSVIAPVLIFLVAQTTRYQTMKDEAEEEVKRHTRIHEVEKKFRLYIENTQDLISVVDRNGFITFQSDSAKTVTGFEAYEMMGRSVLEFVHPDDTPELIRLFKETKAEPEKTVILELRLRKNDGSYTWLKCSGKNMIGDPGVNGIIVNSTDISEKKKMVEELFQAKEKAENSNRLKSDFLAQMSHEIRSPLNTVLSSASLIMSDLIERDGEKINSDWIDCFHSIESSGKRIIRTIDLILNMSEVQLGIYEPSFHKIDIYEDVLEKIVREYTPVASKKTLTLNLNNHTEKSIFFGDSYSISQIFANLIDNAIKYTPRGSISIIMDRDKTGKLRVTVQDSGIGISEDYLGRLFEPFSQEEEGYTRRYEGNGLGLALVRKYCDLNKLSISVESVKGVGSKFIVTF